MKPEKGSIAVCGAGRLGLITSDHAIAYSYVDFAYEVPTWRGIHLEPGWEGKPWQSRNPKVIGHVRDLRTLFADRFDEFGQPYE